ncbi:hypothetical protein ACLOF6_27625 [Bacillus sp. AF53]|uniref:hypothetical protein n=1 Tax=Bacillus sp. AF53 TaxID=3158958 RepID=UPI00398F9869
MKHCIYLNDTEPKLVFNSEEHIFPAGLGGILKLPAEYVSEEANNRFSSMELKTMRDSILALPREFEGPGKRGNLNPKRATASNISVVQNTNAPSEYDLGYIQKGIPYYISQVKVNIANDKCTFTANSSQSNNLEEIKNFSNRLKNYTGNASLIYNKHFDQNEFVLGFDNLKNRWYLSLSNENLIQDVNTWITKINSKENLETEVTVNDQIKAKVHQNFSLTEDDLRVFAKISFNYLSLLFGQRFVLQSHLDPIRDWILNGGTNNFVRLLKVEDCDRTFEPYNLPELAHAIIIVEVKGQLRALINFYGGFIGVIVNLGNVVPQGFIIEGLVCDWKNRNEYRLEY